MGHGVAGVGLKKEVGTGDFKRVIRTGCIFAFM